MTTSVKTLICGAGIAGISAAYHLSVKHGMKDILLVDERAPMTLTSDKSTECYRNWWPGPGDAMVSLMNRSIDIIEDLAADSANLFHLNRRGYLYLTADARKAAAFEKAARIPSQLGAGPLRVHRGRPGDPQYIPHPVEGYQDLPTGADLILDPTMIQAYFPFLPEMVIGALHARRAGWFSAQQLGMYMLEQAQDHGVEYLKARVIDVEVARGQVQHALLREPGSSSSYKVSIRNFVNAAGPLAAGVGRMMGLDLPLFTELHLKVAIRDDLGVVPRDAPLLIWSDPQHLPWSEEERRFLAQEEDTRWLLEKMPPGAHTRPEGGPESDIILLLWEYTTQRMLPEFPPPLDDMYPEIALRGLAAMLPSFKRYFQRLPQPILDGGYYTKTEENRPLIGPLPVQGAYIIGALSGFGLMSAPGAGDLLAAHVTGSKLPHYAPAFNPNRYQDPVYQALLEDWEVDGQL